MRFKNKMKIVIHEELLYRDGISLGSQIHLAILRKKRETGRHTFFSQLVRASRALSRSLLYRGSKNGVGSAARSPVECISLRATTKIRSPAFGSSSSLPCRAFVVREVV